MPRFTKSAMARQAVSWETPVIGLSVEDQCAFAEAILNPAGLRRTAAAYRCLIEKSP
jgi:hypothetical protein